MIYIVAVCAVMTARNGADMLIYHNIEGEVEYFGKNKRHIHNDSGYHTNLDGIPTDKMQEEGWEILTIPCLHLMDLDDIKETMRSIRTVMQIGR